MSGAKSCLPDLSGGEDEMKISFIHLFISSEEVFCFKLIIKGDAETSSAD